MLAFIQEGQFRKRESGGLHLYKQVSTAFIQYLAVRIVRVKSVAAFSEYCFLLEIPRQWKNIFRGMFYSIVIFYKVNKPKI